MKHLTILNGDIMKEPKEFLPDWITSMSGYSKNGIIEVMQKYAMYVQEEQIKLCSKVANYGDYGDDEKSETILNCERVIKPVKAKNIRNIGIVGDDFNTLLVTTDLEKAKEISEDKGCYCDRWCDKNPGGLITCMKCTSPDAHNKYMNSKK